jgi:hypothetical protein
VLRRVVRAGRAIGEHRDAAAGATISASRAHQAGSFSNIAVSTSIAWSTVIGSDRTTVRIGCSGRTSSAGGLPSRRIESSGGA